MINSIILTEAPNNSLKNVDQLLDQREVSENQQVEIRDSLIQEYNLDIFGEENPDIGIEDYATELFYEDSNLDGNVSQSQTAALFTADITYHQSNVTNSEASTLLTIIWLILIIVISGLIMQIIRRRRYAKKNRNRKQTAQLYY